MAETQLAAALERMFALRPAERVAILVERSGVALLGAIRKAAEAIRRHLTSGQAHACGHIRYRKSASLEKQRLGHLALLGVGDFPWRQDDVPVLTIPDARFIEQCRCQRGCEVDRQHLWAPLQL